jgi:hypothetical protein
MIARLGTVPVDEPRVKTAIANPAGSPMLGVLA